MMRRSKAHLGIVGGLLVGLALSGTPAQADSLSIGINIGTPPPAPPVVIVAPPPVVWTPPPPPVVIVAPPPVVVVPGTPVYYAPSVPVNYFVYAGNYYTFHNGAWFYATGYNRPWTFVAVEYVPQPILAVPVTYYKVKPGHWKGGPPPWAGHGKGHHR